MKQNLTLIELWVGDIFISLLALLVGIWFPENKIAYALGLAVGTLTAMYTSWHMARSINKMLDLVEAGGSADRGMRVSSLIRYAVIAEVLAVSATFHQWINPFSVFISIIGLKVAAYLQPFTHKVVSGIFNIPEEEYPEMCLDEPEREGGEVSSEQMDTQS